MAGRYIDAVNGLSSFVKLALVNNGVNGDGRFTRLAVTDDQLALAAADGDHGVDGLDTGLKRLVYRLPEDNPRRFAFQRQFESLAFDIALTVDRFTQWVHNPAYKAFADVDGSNAAGAMYTRAFANAFTRAHEHHTHVIFFQVQHDSLNTGLKLHQFTGLSVIQSINTGNTVSYLKNGAIFLQFGGRAKTGELLF